jgi:TetR/AcrR family transcriptional regulator, transcriptional repressor for nem operon
VRNAGDRPVELHPRKPWKLSAGRQERHEGFPELARRLPSCVHVQEIRVQARTNDSARFRAFTNHFRSKEEFAQEVLDRYFAGTKRFVKEALADESLTPRQRLKRYLDIIIGVAADSNWNLGCLIGDFSLETTPLSELLRLRLEEVFQEWRAPFASCIAEAQVIGEIDSTFDPTDLAEFLLASWEGAILRMKVGRSPAVLERFKKIAFQTVFKELK